MRVGVQGEAEPEADCSNWEEGGAEEVGAEEEGHCELGCLRVWLRVVGMVRA